MAKSAQTATAARVEPLAGRTGGAAGATVIPAKAAFRVSLRADVADAAALSKSLGVKLPLEPKASAKSAKGRLALWLGPDEWLIIDETADPMADLAKCKSLHSAVDISHRNAALLVSGKGARATLEAGCPRDLGESVFPVGAVSRTILGKIEVVIYRGSETEYRVEFWRSFSAYAFGFLNEAAKDCLV
ncbi:MAG: sarcosine oxidase subunit gamma family protein [Hoeflea sp.]|uniref:sarcosine oxidase subunit gamma n=1 Tax=Hoeflea sp. TaxID=1940281 RepID=UPI0032EF94BB